MVRTLNFITLCFPELKLQFVLPLCNILLPSMNALENEQCLASTLYGSAFLTTVRLADDYFLSLSSLHTTKTITVLSYNRRHWAKIACEMLSHKTAKGLLIANRCDIGV
jgi:hypothetical protein